MTCLSTVRSLARALQFTLRSRLPVQGLDKEFSMRAYLVVPVALAVAIGLATPSVFAAPLQSPQRQLCSMTRHTLRVLGQRAKRAERRGDAQSATKLRKIRSTLRDLVVNTWRQGKPPVHHFRAENPNSLAEREAKAHFHDHRAPHEVTLGKLKVHQDGVANSPYLTFKGFLASDAIVRESSATHRIRDRGQGYAHSLKYSLSVTRAGVEFEVRSNSYSPDILVDEKVPR